ncbi:MAG TPA: SIMPL domain-containing protein, partial [Longimicrobiales bacterium]|nr:SIMPL domain-containing protein [Longimicrobiales bacterium]
DVDAVEGLAMDPGALVQNGLVLEGSSLEYFYDDMAALKRSLLRQARDDAQARAEEIAGEGLGSLLEARAGVFQIREPYSTEVEGYGMYSTATRAKEMTVTVHAVFQVR